MFIKMRSRPVVGLFSVHSKQNVISSLFISAMFLFIGPRKRFASTKIYVIDHITILITLNWFEEKLGESPMLRKLPAICSENSGQKRTLKVVSFVGFWKRKLTTGLSGSGKVTHLIKRTFFSKRYCVKSKRTEQEFCSERNTVLLDSIVIESKADCNILNSFRFGCC